MTLSIQEHLSETSATLTRMAALASNVEPIAQRMVQSLQKGGKLVIFGNGGSAADAQHFAAELVGRFESERAGLPAIALTVDTSALTAIANDYSYDQVFARQVEALVGPNDVVIGISTSGNAKSVLNGILKAKQKKAYTVGLSGQTGGLLKSEVDACICVPATRTAHIQECHISLIHAMCARIDEAYSTINA